MEPQATGEITASVLAGILARHVDGRPHLGEGVAGPVWLEAKTDGAGIRGRARTDGGVEVAWWATVGLGEPPPF